ncbi:PglL family O-oligosaccharyltransferase [Aquipseudomonas alcaligenes]|uniref:PglL family O-oligosaccharyltransferase n=1 Tax=Aquipseudomonas alcaligenes TaxID=43263 RepID=UPI0035B3D506
MRALLLLAAFLLLLSWLLPISFRPWTSAYQELLVALALVLALGTVFLGFLRHVSLSRVICSLFLLATIPLLQWWLGVVVYAGDAFLVSAYIVAFAGAMCLGFNLQAGVGGVMPGLAQLLLVGAVVSVGVAFLQWSGLAGNVDAAWITPLAEGVRPYANIGQPNNLATLLSFGLAGLLYLFERRLLARCMAIILAVVLLFGLALAQSRTTWLAGFVIVLYWAWQRRRLTLRLSTRDVLLWFVLFGCMVLVLPTLGDWLGVYVESPFERARQMQRWDMYRQFIYAVMHGPWYGYGWGQAFMAQGEVSLAFPLALPTVYSHNILIDMLIWNGPVLGVGLVLGYVFWLGRLFVGARSLDAVLSWVALIPFLLHCLLEYPFAYLFLLLPAALFLGVIQAEVSGGVGDFSLPKWVVVGVALSSLVTIAAFWRDYMLVEAEYQEALKREEVSFIAEGQQAVSHVWLLSNMREYIYFMRLPLRGDYAASQLGRVLRVAHRYPRDYVLFKGATVMALNGEYDQAYLYLLLLEKLHGKEKLERVLQYFLERSTEHPAYLSMLSRFGVGSSAR